MKNQFKMAMLMAGAAAMLPTVACAEHHGDKKMAASKDNAALDGVLKSDIRKGDMARDKYRNPGKTLTFMGVTPEMTVAEYAPGGGWYSRVLAPYVAEKGKFIGLQFAPDPLPFPDTAKERIRGFNTAFPESLAKSSGLDASKITAYTTDTIPDEAKGTVDFVFIPRMLHNLLRWNVADSEIKAIRALLKDGGTLGIVQHRAKDDAPYSYTDGNKGYLRTADVVAFMDLNGFELVKKAEINANTKDTADYEKGVWTLPPGLRTSKDNAENKAKYSAIGESDRMTLLFKKRP